MLTLRARKLILFLVLALAATAALWRVVRVFDLPPATAAGAEEAARVVRVFDGDTLLVRLDGREEKVRLIGVDTPEKGQPFAAEATAFVRDLVDGKNVMLRADPVSRDRDAYERLLRYVVLEDGRYLDAEIIRRGLGFAYTRFAFERADEYVALEREARDEGRGAWAPANVASVDWREAPGHVGAVVRVRGRVVKTHNTGKVCFLNFDPDYRRHLSVVIFEPDLGRFEAPPEASYLDAEIEVVGRVTEYRGRPQIVVRHPGQIRGQQPK